MSRRSNIRVEHYKHSETSPWVIEGLKVDGKRKRLFFTSKSLAEAELLRIKTKMAREGQAALMLSDDLRIAALEGERKLSELGKNLRWAIDFALDHLKKEQSSIRFSELVTEYLSFQERLDRSAVHQIDLRSRYGHFCETFGDTPTRTLSTKQIQDWLLDLDLSPGSVKNFRTRLSSLCNYAVMRHYMDHNPVTDVEVMEVADGPPGILTPDETIQLLNAASPELLPLISLGAFAGIRTAELIRLNWSHINFSRGFVEVNARKGAQTARRRLIKMEANLVAWLTPFAGKTGLIWIWDGDEKQRISAFQREMLKLGKAAGVKRPHNALRHSFASYHLALYQDAPRLALDLGHTTPTLIFNTYRELVYPEDAKRYFSIFPPAPAENVVSMALASA